MTNLETVILLLVVFMAVPDLCARIHRPGLVYAVLILLGVVLGPTFSQEAKTMVTEIGHVGFLLLLFEVGLDVDLPNPRQLLDALKLALPWALVQYPVIVGLALLADLNLGEACLAAAALSACSVGIAYAGWKSFPEPDAAVKARALRVMVMLEVISIVVLAVCGTGFAKGWDWRVLVNLAGMLVVVLLVSRFAPQITRLFHRILATATHWRVHLLILLVLLVAASGERLGLSGAKTAFFLGLFMAHVEHDGQRLEEYLAPVSQRLLIPVCFVALGAGVQWDIILSITGVLALASAIALLFIRFALHRHWLRVTTPDSGFLLLSPNLTIVALAATGMVAAQPDSAGVQWLLLTGLFVTLTSVFALPAIGSEHRS